MAATATRSKNQPGPYGDITEEEIQRNTSEILAREQTAAERIRASYDRRHSTERPDDAPVQKRHLMYWAKCEREDCFYHPDQRGYIFHHVGTKGPGGAHQVAEFAENTHATPLPEFGQWVANNQALHGTRDKDIEDGLNSADYNPNRPWGSFKELFLAPGGIHRMPLEQFIQCGFHKDRDLASERWDELMATTIYYCEHCPNETRYFTQSAHLNSHSSVMHKAELSAQINSREMGKIWAQQTASTNNVLGEILNRYPAPGGAEESELIKEFRAMKELLAQQGAELNELKKGKAS